MPMRTRSNSGARLDYHSKTVAKTILNRLDPVTGLFASALPGFTDHAWVRDNVYAVHCVWALALAYRNRADYEEEKAKVFELEQVCVKVMRSLLMCMMLQVDKVERFKNSQAPKDSLHAKYSARNWTTVCDYTEWGHVQIDATSLYLLTLAQLTASGLPIVYNLDEVAFVQNLVFYIENAYRIADYGIWERGDKTNHGLPELNASSIGMAKAALQAMNDLDLFGALGSPSSVIHVMADEMQQCHAVLQAMLPRESYSKEVDAGLMSVISYPAFAVESAEKIAETRHKIQTLLQGNYGCCRFLRDGYKTAREDPNRLWYEPWELQNFENIECQWPLFFCFLLLDGLFTGNKEQVTEYRDLIERVVLKNEQGIKLVPELYQVPLTKVEAELAKPGSQDRVAAGVLPYMWAQSLYILGCLIEEGFIQAAELDPLNRRLSTDQRPDTVVQVVVLAEDNLVKDTLAAHGIRVQTVDETSPYVIQPAAVLGRMYAQLGRSEKLGLHGRASADVGLLSTSKLYMVDNRVFVFTPQFMDWKRFYMTHDFKILLDVIKSELFYVKSTWAVPGRPLLAVVITHNLLIGGWKVRNDFGIDATAADGKKVPTGVIGTLKKLKSGYLAGTRVVMGNIDDFITTSCMTRLYFLESLSVYDTPQDVDKDIQTFLENLIAEPVIMRSHLPSFSSESGSRKATGSAMTRPTYDRKMSRDHLTKMSLVSHVAQRRRTMALQADDEDLTRLRLRYSGRPSTDGSPETPGSKRGSFVVGSEWSSGIMSPASLTAEEIEEGSRTPTDDSSPPGSPLLRTSVSLSTRISESHFGEQINCDELVGMLQETENLEDQADIVHYLYLNKGLAWDTRLGGKVGITVRRLLEELYEKSCKAQIWWLVRLAAGLLQNKIEDLAKAVTDLLVRQKQITVGMPATREDAVTKPLAPDELQKVISNAFGADTSSAMLAQELLVYLGMFVRTEPKLFNEMIRLRIGLIIQVMASELARVAHCSSDEASQYLLNLSPYEMKTLLHHILSGKEFGDGEPEDQEIHLDALITHQAKSKAERTGAAQLKLKMMKNKSFAATTDASSRAFDRAESMPDGSTSPIPSTEDAESYGQWLRRRRIDGALNRVPMDFYAKMWSVLRKCEGLNIEGHVLHQNLTKEMTRGETKFALTVESVLNRIPEPEYRQLYVEALMVLTIIAETQTTLVLGPGVLSVRDFVHTANKIFVEDERKEHGAATKCCGKQPPESCGGVAGICVQFYDLAPSGRYGTLTYMCRAIAGLLHRGEEDIECIVS